jgi:hypothetical protein
VARIVAGLELADGDGGTGGGHDLRVRDERLAAVLLGRIGVGAGVFCGKALADASVDQEHLSGTGGRPAKSHSFTRQVVPPPVHEGASPWLRAWPKRHVTHERRHRLRVAEVGVDLFDHAERVA